MKLIPIFLGTQTPEIDVWTVKGYTLMWINERRDNLFIKRFKVSHMNSFCIYTKEN